MILKTIGKIVLAILLIALAAVLLVLAFLFVYPSVGSTPDKRERERLNQRSDHFSDGQFRNEHSVAMMDAEPYPSSDRRRPRRLLDAETPSLLIAPREEDLSFTWLGHSSFLLQLGKITILVDPVLSGRASPVGFAGPKRFSRLPLTAEELPEIDVLFLSHDHYDHLDYQTIWAIRDKVGAFVVPLGLDTVLTGWGVDAGKIRSLEWWESTEINGVTFTLTPSQHFTGRNPLRRNITLWGGVYMDNGAHRVYYTGDGGYYDVFRRVRERLGSPELMLAECGQYDTAWARIHMFPEETVQAGLDAGAQWVVPVHWGSFCICNHAWDDSIRRVVSAAEAAGLPLATPRIGQTVELADIASCTEHWWEAYE